MSARRPTKARQPSTIALSILITVSLLVLAALGWLWLTRYAPVHFDVGDATIEDARRATRIMPLIGLGIALLAMAWLAVWVRARWEITLLPIVVGVIGVLAFVLAGRAFWVGIDAAQPIRILSYSCEANADRIEPGADGIPEGCAIAPEPGHATIGTGDDPAMEEPDDDDTTANAFTGLPPGRYDARLTLAAPDGFASAMLVAETDDGPRPVSRLEHRTGEFWSGTIALHPNLETYALLLYASPYEDAPDATIAFTLQQCLGTSVANFDVSTCSEAAVTTLLVEEIPPSDEASTGRPPTMEIADDSVVVTDLEQRVYTFAPAISLIGNEILVIPAGDDPAADRTILQQTGAPLGTFEIEVAEGTADLAYTIYLIDEGITVAVVRP
jgi:hypothetical protein